MVDHLCAVLVGQCLDRSDLDDDLRETGEVRFVLLLERSALVRQTQSGFLLKGNLPLAELDRRALPGDGFQESVALLLSDIETGPDYSMALLLEDDPSCFHFRAFCVFRSIFIRGPT